MMQIKLFGKTMKRTNPEDLSSTLAHFERGGRRAAHRIVQRDEEIALACRSAGAPQGFEQVTAGWVGPQADNGPSSRRSFAILMR
jgi:hypothetical protein